MNVLVVNHTKSLLKAVDESVKTLKYKIDLSEDIDSVIDEIHKYNSQIILINWSNTPFDIAKVCKNIKKSKHSQLVYIIVIAVRDDLKELATAINAGVDDFVFKPFGKEELQIRFQLAKKILKLESASKKSRKDVLKLAKEDPHTGLFNRRSLLDEVLKEMGRASREMKYISAILTTISNFREVTDYYGAEAGDAILLEFSRRLSNSSRPYDKLGRVGISDFLIILPDSGLDNAEKVAKRFTSAIAKKPFVYDNRKINITISTGISDLNPEDIAKDNHADNQLMNDLILDSLIRRAELALQKAADKGKNSIEKYSFA